MESTREDWEEVCRWVYCDDQKSIDTPDAYFAFFINDRDRLCYYRMSNPEKITEWVSIEDYNVRITNSYYKVRPLQELCGPVQPPPSPIIAKIRASYTRQRNHYGIAI